MTFYSIDMKTNFGCGYLTTKKDLEKIMSDFKFNQGCYNQKIIFFDPDFSVNNRLEKSDVIRTLAGDLFSKRLVNKLEEEFIYDYEFVQVGILDDQKNINNDFFIFRVNNVIDCIDLSSSLYGEDGEIEKMVFDYKKIPNDISVFKVKGEEYITLYTSLFYDFIDKNKFILDVYPSYDEDGYTL